MNQLHCTSPSSGRKDGHIKANNGATPLYIASHQCHVKVVKILVEKGADIDKANSDGYTPLDVVAKHCHHTEIIRLLERAQTRQPSAKKKKK